MRYSTRPLPSTAYVPGVTPRDQRPLPAPARALPQVPAKPGDAVIDLDALGSDDAFRYGVDLFNHGFPWEAHEAWEPLWFAAPRERPERALLHGLIHAAAAAVKAKAGAYDVARTFVASACEYLANASVAIVDTDALVRALHAWAHDPTHPPPAITLRAT